MNVSIRLDFDSSTITFDDDTRQALNALFHMIAAKRAAVEPSHADASARLERGRDALHDLVAAWLVAEGTDFDVSLVTTASLENYAMQIRAYVRACGSFHSAVDAVYSQRGGGQTEQERQEEEQASAKLAANMITLMSALGFPVQEWGWL